MSRPVDPRSDGLFPLEALCDVVALQVVAARQPQEFWMHRRHLLHQVDAVTEGPVMIRRRKKRDQIEPHRSGPWNSHDQVVVRGHRRLPGLERKAVLLPLAREPADRRRCRGHARLIVHQANGDGNPSAVGLGVKGAGIARLRSHRNAPVAVVLQAGRRSLRRRAHAYLQAARQRRARARLLVDRNLHNRVSTRHQRPVRQRSPASADGAVADQLGVETSVI